MRIQRGTLAKCLFFVATVPTVVATGFRISRLDRKGGFKAVVEGARRHGERLLPAPLRRPLWLAGVVERLLPWLPPRRYGTCLRRSLILLELWSRCDLRPRLHLGFRSSPPDPEAHAWLTADAPNGARLSASGPLDSLEAFEI